MSSVQNDKHPSAVELELMRLKNEQSFIIGDRAHGGPERKADYEKLRERIRTIQEKLTVG